MCKLSNNILYCSKLCTVSRVIADYACPSRFGGTPGSLYHESGTGICHKSCVVIPFRHLRGVSRRRADSVQHRHAGWPVLLSSSSSSEEECEHRKR